MAENEAQEGNRQAPLTIQEFYNKKVENIDSIPSKFNNTNDFQRNQSPNPRGKNLGSRENLLSSLQSQAAEIINVTLPNDKIQPLVDVMHSTAKQAINLAATDGEKDKIKLSMAKTEAALKDFELKITTADVEQMKTEKRMGLTQDEVEAIREPLDKAFLKFSEKQIPKEKYANTIMNEVINDFEKAGISKEKLEQYKAFMDKNGHKKYDRKEEFSKTQLEGIEKKTNILVGFYKDKFKEIEAEGHSIEQVEKVDIKNPEAINSLVEVIAKLPVNEIKEKGTEIVKNFAPLLESNNKVLANGAESALEKLNPQYLAQNNKEISEKLQKAANAKPPLMKRIAAKLGFKAPSRDYAAKNINKLVAIFEQASKSDAYPNTLEVSVRKAPSLEAQNLVKHVQESAAMGGTSTRSAIPDNRSKGKGKKEGHGH